MKKRVIIQVDGWVSVVSRLAGLSTLIYVWIVSIYMYLDITWLEKYEDEKVTEYLCIFSR